MSIIEAWFNVAWVVALVALLLVGFLVGRSSPHFDFKALSVGALLVFGLSVGWPLVALACAFAAVIGFGSWLGYMSRSRSEDKL